MMDLEILMHKSDMSKIRVKRHDHYKEWALKGDLPNSYYPAEAAFVNRLQTRPSQLFYPYQFPYVDSDVYHYHVAFLVEAVELLPLKMDLSFDAIWRAFEAFYKNSVMPQRDFKLNQEAPGLAANIDAKCELNLLLDDMFKNIPVQSCEYLVERIFQQWQIPSTDYTKIVNRLNNPAGNHLTIVDFLNRVAAKYRAPNLHPDNHRKAAMLLRLALDGQEVDVQGSKITLPRSERISFFINALLYTFRNDRFHGNVQPPFKSSVGTLQTYAHVHYCLIWAHFLLLFSMAISNPPFVKHRRLAENTQRNLVAFRDFYGSHLKT
jgi:hypothetical protein